MCLSQLRKFQSQGGMHVVKNTRQNRLNHSCLSQISFMFQSPRIKTAFLPRQVTWREETTELKQDFWNHTELKQVFWDHPCLVCMKRCLPVTFARCRCPQGVKWPLTRVGMYQHTSKCTRTATDTRMSTCHKRTWSHWSMNWEQATNFSTFSLLSSWKLSL